MGAVLAVTGLSVVQFSNTLKENNIQLIDAEGNAFAQPGVEDLNALSFQDDISLGSNPRRLEQ